ncbi:MAG: metal ABC transporter ATP-binding protein [Candidatus Dependentiae bacterium]
MRPIISIENLTVTYHEKVLLWCIHAKIMPGNIVGIMGPNGAGKSTLLKTMIGTLKPFAGTISFFGQTFKKHALKIAYIPQRSEVDWDFPITVKEVVMMGRYGHIGWFGSPQQTDYDHVSNALEMVNMQYLADRHIAELSGGQQQRVFLARALAQQSEIYLLDEPFIGIDTTTEKAIMNVLKQLRNEGKTIVIVHHDLQTVENYFDQLLLLNVKQTAFGPVNQIYNQEIIQQTYAQHTGRL